MHRSHFTTSQKVADRLWILKCKTFAHDTRRQCENCSYNDEKRANKSEKAGGSVQKKAPRNTTRNEKMNQDRRETNISMEIIFISSETQQRSYK